MSGPRLSQPESSPFYLWIERHPWWVGLIAVGFMLCLACTFGGMAYLFSIGALTPGPSASATP